MDMEKLKVSTRRAYKASKHGRRLRGERAGKGINRDEKKEKERYTVSTTCPNVTMGSCSKGDNSNKMRFKGI